MTDITDKFPADQVPYEDRLAVLPPNYFFDGQDVTKGRFIPTKLADELINTYNFIHFKDSDELYYCNSENIYEENAEQFIAEECRLLLKDQFKEARFREVKAAIRASRHPNLKRTTHADIRVASNLIPVANGVFDIDVMQLKPYSKDLLMFNRIPIAYDPSAQCPNFLKYLEEDVVRQDERDTLQEFFGYCLVATMKFHRCLWLLGPTHSGKSLFINVMKAFFHDNRNISNIPLQTLVKERNEVARLYGKYVNTFADIPKAGIKDAGIFLALTGDDWVSGRPHYKKSFEFKNTCKLLFSANKTPRISDKGDEFYIRIQPIMFPNQFLGPHADVNLLEKLTTPGELSGILNWALQGLKRLYANNKFSLRLSVEEIRKEFDKLSDSVTAFILDMLEEDEKAIVPKSTLYAAYAKYCHDNNLLAEYENVFFRELGSSGELNLEKVRTGTDKRVYSIKGAKLRAPEEYRPIDHNQKELELGQELEPSPISVAPSAGTSEKTPDRGTIFQKPVEPLQKGEKEPPEKAETQPRPEPKLVETPLERLEHYMKREKSVGVTSACQHLRLTPEELTALMGHTNKITWSMTGQILTWAPKPQGEKLEVDCTCGTKTTVYPPKDQLTRVVKCQKCGRENKLSKLKVCCTGPTHQSPGAIYTDWFRDDIPWGNQKCSICQLHGDLKVIHEKEGENKK